MFQLSGTCTTFSPLKFLLFGRKLLQIGLSFYAMLGQAAVISFVFFLLLCFHVVTMEKQQGPPFAFIVITSVDFYWRTFPPFLTDKPSQHLVSYPHPHNSQCPDALIAPHPELSFPLFCVVHTHKGCLGGSEAQLSSSSRLRTVLTLQCKPAELPMLSDRWRGGSEGF